MARRPARRIGLALTIALTAAAFPAPADDRAPLPLQAAVSRALAAAPQRRAAAARVAAARGALEQAGRLPNPAVEIRGENLRVGGYGLVTGHPPLDFYALVNQPVELGGKRGRRTAVATADLAGRTADLEVVEREVVLATTRHYLGALRAREFVQYLAENRAELEPLLHIVQRRVHEGYSPEADLARLRAEAARVEAQLAEARLELERERVALATTLGDPLPVAPERLVEPPLPALPDGRTEDLAERILAGHPALRSLRAQAERARDAVALEKAQRVPNPLLTGGYKRVDHRDAMVLAVVVPIPVLDTNAGNIERALGEARAATADLDALRRQLAVDAVALVTAARDLARRAHRIQADLVEPAHVAREAARASFREVATSVLVLVDAERVHTEAHRDALDLTLAAIARGIELRLALGEEPFL